MCALVSAVRGLKAKFLNLKYKRKKNVSTLQQKLISMYTLSALQIVSGWKFCFFGLQSGFVSPG